MPNNQPSTLTTVTTQAMTALIASCTSLALHALNVPSYLSGNLRAQRGLQYGERSDQKLDLYLPADSAGARRRLVVFIHGGAWSSGSRGLYYYVAQTLTAQGYAVAIPDYIKYPQGTFPTFVTDVAEAINWLANHIDQEGNMDDLVLMGHSAGAHTGALLLTDSRYLAAVGVSPQRISAFIGLAGPYAFRPKEKKYRDIFNNLEDYNQMRPLHFAHGDAPPMLLLHGNDDSTVLPNNSARFAERINASGGDARAKFYEGVGHVAPVLALSRTPLRHPEICADILAFLETQETLTVDSPFAAPENNH